MAYSPDHALDPASAVPSGPPWPNPLASIAYASCRPADCEPPAEDSALTSRAAYERLNRAAARAETLVLYRLDMLSGCRDSLDVDQTRLEQSIQNLWRLTAVRKTLMSIEAALNAPTPTPQDTTPGVDLQSALASAEPPLPADAAVQPTPSPDGSHSSYPSHPSHPSHSASSSLVAPSPSPQVPPSSSVAPSPVLPFAPSSLAIRAVPACPRMSLSSVARTLDRVNADMANYTEFTFTADYGSNVTAEEFLRPSCSPKSSRVPAHTHTPAPDADNSASAGDDEAALLDDPNLSPSLKSQISHQKSSPRPSPAGDPVSPQLQSLLDLKQSLDRHRPPD